MTTNPTPPPPDDRNHPVDAAVRAHLDREAESVDARRVLARIKAAQPKAVPSTHRRGWVRWAVTAAGVGIAACLVIALLLPGTPVGPPPRELSAAELVQEAKAAHEETPADRCYEVVADWEIAPFLKRFKFQPIRKAKIWTRGDQFVALSAVDADSPWAWGQEQSGRVWLAASRKNAIVFDADELNEPLARFCELMSLRMVSTLAEMLDKYDLYRLESEPGGPIRIDATARPARVPGPRLARAELELDPTTKVVKRATLHRELNGEVVGTLTFTLIENAAQPDNFYTLTGHIDENAVVHDGRPLANPPPPPITRPPLPNRFDPKARQQYRDDLLKKLQNRPMR